MANAGGRPMSQMLGHTFGDAPGFAYRYLWSWGGCRGIPGAEAVEWADVKLRKRYLSQSPQD